ncbi:MAG: pentapeptide repeat-containing protein [Halobacteriales archaeon]|nr:pentapeptide repeat-containing protein [Halobacteriales archaeon]
MGTEGTCGYSLPEGMKQATDDPSRLAADRLSFGGACCCVRPIYDGSNRCIWHARTGNKSRDLRSERAGSTGPERLDGAYLVGTNLSGVNLVGCSLRGAKLASSALVDADLSNADLSDADCPSLDARGAHFTDADLEGANLRNANLNGSELRNCRLAGSDLTGARIDESTKLDHNHVYESEGRLDDAARVYRSYAELATEAGLVSSAIDFIVRERDLRRRQAWASGRLRDALGLETLRLTSRYGLSPLRVLLVSVVIVSIFAVLYPTVGAVQDTTTGAVYSFSDLEGTPDRIGVVIFNTVYFSVVTFTTLGYGDIYPVGPVAKYLATVESFIGVVLMVLLGFVLGNRATTGR